METLRPRRHEELVVPLDLGAPAELVLRQDGLDGRGLGLAAPLGPRRRRRLALARRRLRVAHRDLRRRGQIRCVRGSRRWGHIIIGIEVRIDLVGLLVVGVGVVLDRRLLLGRAEREAGPRAARAAAAAAPRDDARGDGRLERALLLAIVVAVVRVLCVKKYTSPRKFEFHTGKRLVGINFF